MNKFLRYGIYLVHSLTFSETLVPLKLVASWFASQLEPTTGLINLWVIKSEKTQKLLLYVCNRFLCTVTRKISRNFNLTSWCLSIYISLLLRKLDVIFGKYTNPTSRRKTERGFYSRQTPSRKYQKVKRPVWIAASFQFLNIDILEDLEKGEPHFSSCLNEAVRKWSCGDMRPTRKRVMSSQNAVCDKLMTKLDYEDDRAAST